MSSHRIGPLIGIGVLALAAIWAAFEALPDRRTEELPAPLPNSTSEPTLEEVKWEGSGRTTRAPRSNDTDGNVSTTAIELENTSLKIRGAVVVVDDRGETRPANSADFQIRLVDDPRGRDLIRVSSAGSGFEATFPRQAAFSVVHALVDGQPAHPLEEYFDWPMAEVDFELRVRLVPHSVLRVRGSESGVELVNVRVLSDVPVYRGRRHPGSWSSEDVCTQGDSPVRLPARFDQQSYWVTADGYAWRDVTIDHSGGGEREVRLDAGARLDVTLDPHNPEFAIETRVYPEVDGEVERNAAVEMVPDESGRTVFDSLVPGSYRVRSEIGEWWDPPLRLAEASVDLGLGEHLEVVLRPEGSALQSQPVSVSGELWLSEGATDLELQLILRPPKGAALRKTDIVRLGSSDLRQVQGRADRLRFDAGPMTPGVYMALVSPIQFGLLFTVPDVPLRDLVIELPDLKPVSVDVVDADTGAPLPIERIAWSPRKHPDTSVWRLQNVKPSRIGRFEFVAPRGRISGSMQLRGYSDGRFGLQVTDDVNAQRVEMQRLPGFAISLMDGESSVPGRWQESGYGLRAVDSESELKRGSGYFVELENGRFRLLLRKPGRYELSFPSIRGFQSVEKRWVDVTQGHFGNVIVSLSRE